jgi:hypothetical protein
MSYNKTPHTQQAHRRSASLNSLDVLRAAAAAEPFSTQLPRDQAGLLSIPEEDSAQFIPVSSPAAAQASPASPHFSPNRPLSIPPSLAPIPPRRTSLPAIMSAAAKRLRERVFF